MLARMAIGVVVHGVIEYVCYGHDPESKRVYRHNKRVIDSLPVSDGEWPFMPRVMFSILPIRASIERKIPQYENGLIHFAGDYKNMYSLEAEWIQKFEERLLRRLCWSRAVVNLDFSGLRYEWQAQLADKDDVPRQWMFRCLQVIAERIEPREAIEGGWASPFQVPWKDGLV
jgi:hypothetical protein